SGELIGWLRGSTGSSREPFELRRRRLAHWGERIGLPRRRTSPLCELTVRFRQESRPAGFFWAAVDRTGVGRTFVLAGNGPLRHDPSAAGHEGRSHTWTLSPTRRSVPTVLTALRSPGLCGQPPHVSKAWSLQRVTPALRPQSAPARSFPFCPSMTVHASPSPPAPLAS